MCTSILQIPRRKCFYIGNWYPGRNEWFYLSYIIAQSHRLPNENYLYDVGGEDQDMSDQLNVSTLDLNTLVSQQQIFIPDSNSSDDSDSRNSFHESLPPAVDPNVPLPLPAFANEFEVVVSSFCPKFQTPCSSTCFLIVFEFL